MNWSSYTAPLEDDRSSSSKSFVFSCILFACFAAVTYLFDTSPRRRGS